MCSSDTTVTYMSSCTTQLSRAGAGGWGLGLCLRTQITLLCSHASGPTLDPSPRPVSLRRDKAPWPSYHISPISLQSKALKEKSPIGVSGSCLSSSTTACNYGSILHDYGSILYDASLCTKHTLVKIRTECPLLADE